MSSASVTAELDAVLGDATARLAAAPDLETITALDTEFLGKKSAVTVAKKQLGQLDPSDRKAAGQAINAARAALEQAVADARERLAVGARQAQYESERLDLTERLAAVRRGSLHLNTQARDRLEDVFVSMGFTIAEGPEVETAWYDFEALNIPDWHPARGSFDTIFVNLGEPEQVMLRSHTSPVQIRTMENIAPPIYIVAPGRTFRTDTADATHLPAFNQIEGLVVDRGITLGDLHGTIEAFVHAFFGGEVADPHVECTAADLQRLPVPLVDVDELDLVGIGVRAEVEHLGEHDPIDDLADDLRLLDGEAECGQRLSEHDRITVDVGRELAQPGQGDLHQNCLRKRTSLLTSSRMSSSS